MKKVFFLLASTFFAGQVLSQQFEKIFEIPLPDSISTADPYWADLDNDGLLDVILATRSATGHYHLYFIAGDTTDAPLLSNTSKAIIRPSALMLFDYDHNNQIDVVVSDTSGVLPQTIVYLNLGNFSFQEQAINLPPFSTARIGDLNSDARPDWLVSGESSGERYVRVYQQAAGDVFSAVHDSLSIFANGLEIIDSNRDGLHDLFISGSIDSDSLASGPLNNSGAYYFKTGTVTSISGSTAISDLNYDGVLDILVAGVDENDQPATQIFRSNGPGFEPIDGLPALRNAHPFAGDFNSDGQVDINYYGTMPVGDTVNTIHFAGGGSEELNTEGLMAQRFGDREHDGDLDLVQVVDGDLLAVVFYDNSISTVNLAPGAARNGVAVPIFDRMFVFWEPSGDDHTPVVSLTYDLHLEGNPEFLPGSFDLLEDRRLTVSHGNNLTANFRLLRDIPAGDFHFSVQAIDNAYNAGAQCVGSAGPCAEVKIENLTACSNEVVPLVATAPVYWFSFSRGFLGIADHYDMDAASQDTVFYYNPQKPGCDGLNAWTVQVNDDTTRVEISERAACEAEQIQLSVEEGWSTVEWSSLLKGDLGGANSIDYVVSQPDTIFANLLNQSGCALLRKTAVRISKPTLVLGGDSYKIAKGSSVQLQVNGAATYDWKPVTGLDNANIANPVASPQSSIQYTVTGYDSLGCEGEATVNIIVEAEGAGFIPNLFTPNDDGTNDQLKIYGLPPVKEFSFSIFNREGAMVFKTTDVHEASQRGWDGTKNGSKQPAGVYFWKVSGEASAGGTILLNGKDSGSIVLVR